ncbi:MAG: ABC transporter permease [Candidatus Bathyarchaeia archaeon]
MRWIVKRALTVAVTLFSALTLIFFLIRIMPGNPIDMMIGQLIAQGYDYKEAATRVAALLPFVPDAPLIEQYIDYLKGFFTGDLGKSILLAVPITTILNYAIPWTVFLVSISLLTSFSLGILLGMFMAYRRGGILDKAFSLLSSVTRALPPYVVGVLLALFFAVQVKWFPVMGPYDARIKPGFTLDFIASVFYHATLPVMSYVITTIGSWILQMKSSTVSVLGEYYVTAAEARGLPERRIVTSYVGRNAILPLFTSLAISIGFIFSGSVFIETIYSYPGIGRFLATSVTYRDYTLMTGCFLVTTVAVVLSNFLADLLYSRLDPRIRLG